MKGRQGLRKKYSTDALGMIKKDLRIKNNLDGGLKTRSFRREQGEGEPDVQKGGRRRDWGWIRMTHEYIWVSQERKHRKVPLLCREFARRGGKTESNTETWNLRELEFSATRRKGC